MTLKKSLFGTGALCFFLILIPLGLGEGMEETGSEDASLGETSEPSMSSQAVPNRQQWVWSDADVRGVFGQLSKVAGIDIVLSDGVSGKVTLKLTGKTWKDVFNVVCRLRKLIALESDGYLYVVTEGEFQQDQVTDAASDQAVEQLSRLRREVIRVNNLAASEMQGTIVSLLSKRGKVTVAQHSNCLIVYDTDDNIDQIRDMVNKLDIETQQVSISAKIIEVSSGALQNLGIQWGLFGNMGGMDASVEHIPDGTGSGDIVANAMERLSYGILSQDRFAITLEYLFGDNKGEIVAQPSITTLDNKLAEIFMGQKVQVLYQDEARNTLIKYVDAGTRLTVTPHVTDGKRIMLTLAAKKESPGQGGMINSQSANTAVVVNNGETVVIAGLTTNEVLESEEGVPVLKNIPLLGNLFKRSTKTVSKKDLIIFVTPHIIQKDIEAVSAEAAGDRLDRETETESIAE